MSQFDTKKLKKRKSGLALGFGLTIGITVPVVAGVLTACLVKPTSTPEVKKTITATAETNCTINGSKVDITNIKKAMSLTLSIKDQVGATFTLKETSPNYELNGNVLKVKKNTLSDPTKTESVTIISDGAEDLVLNLKAAAPSIISNSYMGMIVDVPNNSTVGAVDEDPFDFSLVNYEGSDVQWSVSPVAPSSEYDLNTSTGQLIINTAPTGENKYDLTISALYGNATTVTYNITIVAMQRVPYTFNPTVSTGTSYSNKKWYLTEAILSNADATITFNVPTELPNAKFVCLYGSYPYTQVEDDYGDDGYNKFLKFNNGVLTIKKGTTANDIPDSFNFTAIYTDNINLYLGQFRLTWQ